MMHIMEGYLPFKHAALWTLASGLIVQGALRNARRCLEKDRQTLFKLGAAIGFCFLLSSLKLPSVAGSSSHPTGIGLGTMLLGASMMPLVGLVTLFFQAVLLAHGGLTTLGANTFSLAIFGPLIVSGLYKTLKSFSVSDSWAVGIATAVGSMSVYVCTSFQLGIAFQSADENPAAAFLRFMLLFAPSQAPLSVLEALVTVFCLRAMGRLDREQAYATRN